MKSYTHTASTGKRLVALLIDRAIFTLCYAPALSQYAWFYLKEGQGQVSLGLLALCWLFSLIIQSYFLYQWGGTPGKLLLGLRVVNVASSSPLYFLQALIRIMTDQLSLIFGLAPRCFAFVRFDRRHVSDWVAETRVVQSQPRVKLPQRRWLLAIFGFFYFGITEFMTTYTFVQQLEFKQGYVQVNSDSVSEWFDENLQDFE